MLPKQSGLQLNEPVMPELDEGWWASVLADEETYHSSKRDAENQSSNAMGGVLVNWELVKKLYEQDEIIKLEVYGFNRGGLLVHGEEIQGFVPISHLIDIPIAIEDEKRKEILNKYMGKELELKVIECEETQERIVLSERAALAGEGRRKQLFEILQNGSIAQGIITNVTEFGAFVDLGGVEGLIHVSELSWGRVQNPTEIVSVGQTIKVLVLQVSEENSRIALSLKRLHPNPWNNLQNHYAIGDVVSATITSITRFGIFARLDEGVEGLIHISSITKKKDFQDLHELFEVGQQILVKIIHIDIERRRLGLGLAQIE